MGYFAVATEEGGPSFQVAQCHINLWQLQGTLSWPEYLFDVGLRLRASDEDDLSSLQLGLPFRTKEESLTDLSEMMLQPNVAQLIFGKPIAGLQADRITIDFDWGTETFRLLSVQERASEYRARQSSETFSLWRIVLSAPVRRGEEAYIRLRFRVEGCGRMGARKWNGALVDLRVSDVRETPSVPDGVALQGRIVEIDKLFAFVIVPSHLQSVTISPATHYVRLLEGRVWEQYLNRRTPSGRSAKMVIYAWRNEEGKRVSVTSPFRIFLDLSKASRIFAATNYVLFALVLLAVLFLGHLWEPSATRAYYALAPLWERTRIVLGVVIVLMVAIFRRDLAIWAFRELRHATSSFLLWMRQPRGPG
jgi:hypothetical protein